MIGTRQCRSCGDSMAVAGNQGHTRCPHCNCWMPTRESWTLPLMFLGGLGFIIFLIYPWLTG